tara:strand:- start:292 stop:507 length:216 start_codon:yes stop_codon:yes gene_type:complete
MKPIMITLMYLTFGGDIKLTTFEINDSCSSWWHHNVVAKEKQKKTFMTNHYYYMHDKKRVVGYICGGEEPK